MQKKTLVSMAILLLVIAVAILLGGAFAYGYFLKQSAAKVHNSVQQAIQSDALDITVNQQQNINTQTNHDQVVHDQPVSGIYVSNSDTPKIVSKYTGPCGGSGTELKKVPGIVAIRFKFSATLSDAQKDLKSISSDINLTADIFNYPPSPDNNLGYWPSGPDGPYQKLIYLHVSPGTEDFYSAKLQNLSSVSDASWVSETWCRTGP